MNPLNPKESKDKKVNEALKYADLGWRMLGIVGLSVAGGYFLNQKWPNTHPLFLVLLPMLGLIASMYMLLKAGRVKKKK